MIKAEKKNKMKFQKIKWKIKENYKKLLRVNKQPKMVRVMKTKRIKQKKIIKTKVKINIKTIVKLQLLKKNLVNNKQHLIKIF